MQKLYEITVKGKWKKWAFNFWADDHMKEWEKDGLEVTRILNTVPEWAVKMGLTRIWCWLQDKNIIPLE
jgi:hypothetical protein